MKKYEFKLNENVGFYWIAESLDVRNTKYQKIEIINTKQFGKAMLLDNNVMFTEFDEHVYHEYIVYPNVNQLENFNNALIIGGGDGLCAKRLLEYPFKKVVQVEIDREVIELSKKHFLNKLENTFNDKRLVLEEQDALKYFPCKEKYNFIALDLTDPQEDNQLSNNLFSDKFYNDCKKALDNNGILVVQVGCPYLFPKHFSKQKNILEKLFNYTWIYGTYMHCYGMHQYFITCSNTINNKQPNWELINDNFNQYNKAKVYNLELHKKLL